MSKKKEILITIIGILSILLIMIGTTYSLFNYTKQGSTENNIKLGSITFKYTENENVGNGISISEALPISDNLGKVQTGEGKIFDFKVEANLSRSDLEYEVTAELEEDSTLPLDAIKFYLTDITEGTEKEINKSINLEGNVKTLNEYDDTLITNGRGKTIYQETISRNTKGYEKHFRARMWISENINWTDEKYMGKTATVKINVYANSNRDMAATDTTSSIDTRIERITANNKYLFTEVENEDYQYTLTVPYETEEIDINVITSNTDAEVEVIQVNRTLGLQIKENYFKAIVTSSDKTKSKEYILQVIREVDTDNSLFSLKVDGYSLTPTFDPEILEYNLTVETNNIEIQATSTSNLSSITGTGTKELSWGENNFDVIVTSQDGLIRTYKIKINNERPTAPTITGGSESWVSKAPTISVEKDGFAISGVKHYEYYKSIENIEPTDLTEATGITTNEIIINNEGTTYIWYRTVSNNDFKSKWSEVQIIKLDTIIPTVPILYVKDESDNSIIGTINQNKIETIYTYNKSIITAESTDNYLDEYSYIAYTSNNPVKNMEVTNNYSSNYSRIDFTEELKVGDTLYFDFIIEVSSLSEQQITSLEFNDTNINYYLSIIDNNKYRIFGVYTITDYAVTGIEGGREFAYDKMRFIDINTSTTSQYNIISVSIYKNVKIETGSFTSSLDISTDAITFFEINSTDLAGNKSSPTFALVVNS